MIVSQYPDTHTYEPDVKLPRVPREGDLVLGRGLERVLRFAPADWLRGGRRAAATSGVQRSCEVLPAAVLQQHKLVKQSSKDSNDGSVSSEGSK
jgi:hypothetical protein